MSQRFELEKYNGRNRFACPGCNAAHSLARYIDNQSEIAFAPHVGRCNRETSCGYNFTPKQFFDDNPNLKPKSDGETSRRNRFAFQRRNAFSVENFAPKSVSTNAAKTDFIDEKFVERTWTNSDRNEFVLFLRSMFSARIVDAILSVYHPGTTQKDNVIFWQFDKNYRTRTGKIIAYDSQTGKRKDFTSFAHAELKKRGLLPQNFNLEQCFFGEHLITANPHIKNVAIVESEKTACICAAFRQDVIFLASSGSNGLQDEKFEAIKNKRIVLYPDADKFDVWSKRAESLRSKGFDVRTSELINRSTNDAQKQAGYDLADYLIKIGNANNLTKKS